MTTLYLFDEAGNYTGTHIHEQYQAVPPNSTTIEPPAAEFVVWNGASWDVRTSPAVANAPSTRRRVFVPESISFAQLLIGLVTEGWITEAEGEAWLDGALPAAVTALIDAMPAEQRFIALARAKRPSEILRNDPMVVMLGADQGKTAEELDQFFRTYANV